MKLSAQTAPRFSLRNLQITDEKDLRQVSDFAPQFVWQYSHLADEYLLKMELYQQTPTGDSLLWDSGLVTMGENAFRFLGLSAFTKGERYRFTISAKHPEMGWSEPQALVFTINSPPTIPQIILPPNQIIAGSPMSLSFQSAHDREVEANQLQYQVKIASDPALRNVLLDTSCTGHAGLFPITIRRNFPDNRIYFVSARAGDGVEFSPWSGIKSFHLNLYNEPPGVFDLLSPPDQQVLNAPPLLKWQATTDPDAGLDTDLASYIVEIATDARFKNLQVQDSVPAVKTEYLFANPANHLPYYWRIRACDAGGLITPSRQTFRFTANLSNQPPPSPVIIAPKDTVILNPESYLEWIIAPDPDLHDRLACEVKIHQTDDPSSQIVLALTDSALERARAHRTAGLTVSYDNHVRLQLNRLPDFATLRDGQCYHLSITVKDDWGGITLTDQPNAVFKFDDGINLAPGPPQVPFTPDNQVVNSHNPILRWGPASDPDIADKLRYQVVLSRDPTFGGRTFIQQESAFERCELKVRTPLLENRQYFWKVRTVDLADAKSEWSKVSSFWVNNINEPPSGVTKLLAPKHLSEFDPNTCFWWQAAGDPDPGDSVDYLLEFDLRPEFNPPLLQIRTNGHCEPTLWKEKTLQPGAARGYCLAQAVAWLKKLNDNELYYWRVVSIDNHGLTSSTPPTVWRAAFNPQNNPPRPVKKILAPKPGEMLATNRPEIRWEATSDPDFADFHSNITYEIEVCPNSQFHDATQIFRTDAGQNYLQIPLDLTENVRWFFRLRARDQHGTASPWSELSSFITNARKEAPYTITSGFIPRDSSIVDTQRPQISWLAAGDPDPNQVERDLHYLVRYYEAGEPRKFSQLTTRAGITNVLLPNLKEDKYYCYQVTAVDPDGKVGEWSAPVCFGVNAMESPPEPFLLLAPAFKQDSVALDAGFIWRPTRDRDPGSSITYTLYYSRDSTFQQNVTEVLLTLSAKDTLIAYYPPDKLDFAACYFWKVLATDNKNLRRWGSGTETRPFVFTTIGARGLAGGSEGTDRYILHQNYPNPFNTETRIQFENPEYGPLEVAIYDLLGQRLKLLASGNYTQGLFTTYWDGTDQDGSPVPGGIYICRLTARGYVSHIKVVLMR